jgi:signal transduction histidine kinase
VDAFIARYTETIERQHGQLRSFGRLVSHEIRQPLGVLQVLTRLLQPANDPDRRRLVETLERNVVRLGDVAGKLERLARLTRRSDNAPNDQSVDLGAVSRDVAGQLADMADVRGVTFDIADDLPQLTADAGRVELVLMNLFANAVKYSDPAKPVRVVRVRCVAATSGRSCVEDNGIGIPAAQRAAIFEQFVRVHAHLDDELGSQGLGLGLSIVRECMDAMGGAVAVESAESEGTTFVLTWPPAVWTACSPAAAP